jgi:hypothetical protein
MLVCPDRRRPPEPGGIVKRRPGLSAKKRVVVTIKSVFVKTRPIAFAMRLYTRKNTSAWNIVAICEVFPFTNLRERPSVVKRTPGLSAKKRAAGTATFWEVISGSMVNI